MCTTNPFVVAVLVKLLTTMMLKLKVPRNKLSWSTLLKGIA